MPNIKHQIQNTNDKHLRRFDFSQIPYIILKINPIFYQVKVSQLNEYFQWDFWGCRQIY